MATTSVTSDESRTIQDRFIPCFGVGLLLISTSKLLPLHPIVGGLLAAGLGIVLMWWYKAKEQQDRHEEEWPRLGDEVYYLGLLFTLTSLCVALVALFLLKRGGDLATRTDEMIGSFGIALLTTMAGIVLRTVLQRPGGVRGPETVIRIPSITMAAEEQTGGTKASNRVGAGASLGGATVDLEAYALELRKQLEGAADAFTALGNKVNQQADIIQKHADEFSAGLKHRADVFLGEIETKAIAAAEGLEERTKRDIGRLQTVFAEAAGGAAAAARAAETQQEGMQRVLATLTAHVTGLEGSVARIRSASTTAADQFGSITEKVASAVERLDGMARVQRQHDELLESAVGGLRHLVHEAKQGLEGQRNLEDAVRGIEDMAAMAKSYANVMQEAGREVERTSAELKSLQVVVQQEGMGLAAAVRQAIAAVEKARRREQEARQQNRWWRRIWRRASRSVSQ